MKIHFTKPHKSIELGFSWSGIPSLAILTGQNGAGKTHLLEGIAASLGAYALPLHLVNQRSMGQPIPSAVAEIEGAGVQLGDGKTLHIRSDWTKVLNPGVAHEQQIVEAVNQVLQQKDETFWNHFEFETGVRWSDATAKTMLEFTEILTPRLLLRSQVASANVNIAMFYLVYAIMVSTELAKGRQEADIEAQYGPKPWNELDQVLKAASLPFEVIAPIIAPSGLIQQPRSYGVRFQHIYNENIIDLADFSSGEKVIVATAFWEYLSENDGLPYKLLLLDEPDAHLHPSMTRNFMQLLQRRFIERGARVIMTTHSPSTVALAPKGSVFIKTPAAQSIDRAATQGEAVSLLTDGFVTADDATRIVLVEGITDLPFYSMLLEVLTQQFPVPGPVPAYPGMAFIRGHGKTTVRPVVRQLREIGQRRFHAVLDRDSPHNKPEDGIYVLKRDAYENYLFDPINVWVCLRRNNKDAPVIPAIALGRQQEAYVRTLSQAQLQLIVDAMWALFKPYVNDITEADEDQTETIFHTGQKVKYPTWFFDCDDEILVSTIRRAVSPYPLPDNALMDSYRVVNMVPVELVELMRGIKDAPL